MANVSYHDPTAISAAPRRLSYRLHGPCPHRATRGPSLMVSYAGLEKLVHTLGFSQKGTRGLLATIACAGFRELASCMRCLSRGAEFQRRREYMQFLREIVNFWALRLDGTSCYVLTSCMSECSRLWKDHCGQAFHKLWVWRRYGPSTVQVKKYACAGSILCFFLSML